MEIRENGTRRGRMYRYIKIVLIILGGLLVLLCVFLVRDWLTLRRENLISTREFPLSEFVKKHGPLTADEAGVIRPWMTFDYVNTLFALPPDFIKDNFQITDSRYPNLAIDRYASGNNLNAVEFTNSLAAAIGDHLRK